MVCFYCKNEMLKESKAIKVIEFDSNIIIIRNVPCLECELCGEKYFIDEVMAQLENIVNTVKEVIQEVSIIDYAKVA
ncbi:MAG: type II toxin-antitoxin system MqsA family antitoxin [Lachnospiraceae bacterium]|nr:type II toxin-antitoxin system MqsA family antitoxin [Lachnospiraceae bacterium]